MFIEGRHTPTTKAPAGRHVYSWATYTNNQSPSGATCGTGYMKMTRGRGKAMMGYFPTLQACPGGVGFRFGGFGGHDILLRGPSPVFFLC